MIRQYTQPMRGSTTKCSVLSSLSLALYRTVAAMSENKTEILIIDSLIGKKLTKEQAEIVAARMQQNTKDLARFLAIEDQLDDIIKVVENGKKAVKWLVGLLVANYIGTFWGSIEAML